MFKPSAAKDVSTEDKKLRKAAQDFIKAAKMEAKKQDLYQSVILSYGNERLARLKSISKKYDPMTVSRKLRPGGFKIEGAPYGEST
ncbi:hypothetical protein yc1106_01020 [Curvularia clavata]|uniref:Uncharacterized protein n=1 Tax=Curvularia clavata TaxID=95742 RepID=A0A9Q9DPW6_CURCL|nr:hypothetical protein yc1106_01020 [Curvularia clavata]